jgi:hypothetical protein
MLTEQIRAEWTGKGIDVKLRPTKSVGFSFDVVNIFGSLSSPQTTANQHVKDDFKNSVRDWHLQTPTSGKGLPATVKIKNTTIRKSIIIQELRQLEQKINFY